MLFMNHLDFLNPYIAKMLYIYIYIYISKVGDRSRGRPEDSLFDSYDTEM